MASLLWPPTVPGGKVPLEISSPEVWDTALSGVNSNSGLLWTFLLSVTGTPSSSPSTCRPWGATGAQANAFSSQLALSSKSNGQWLQAHLLGWPDAPYSALPRRTPPPPHLLRGHLGLQKPCILSALESHSPSPAASTSETPSQPSERMKMQPNPPRPQEGSKEP